MTDEHMTIVEPARKIVDSTIMTAIARLSMVFAVPLICALAYLYQGWQNDKLDTIRDQVAGAADAANFASTKASDVSDRLIAVETKQAKDAASSSQFQAEMFSRQDRMQDAIIGLSKSVSALTATVQALADNQRQQRSDHTPD